MKPGEFILDGIPSANYGCWIQHRPAIVTPKRDETGEYEDTEMELTLYVRGTETRTASMNRELVHEWFDSVKYMDFIPYWDPKKLHRVKTETAPVFATNYVYQEGQPFELTLKVQPYKRYLPEVTVKVPGPMNLINPYQRAALPLIKVTGTGNITITINGRAFLLKGVTGHIWLDSQLMFAYSKVGTILDNENDKVFTREYPVLDPGNNQIAVTGGVVTDVTVYPRWRCLA